MTTKQSKPGPGLVVSIVMPAAIPVPSANPVEWLSSIEMRLQLTHDMATDGRIEMPAGTDAMIREAQRWCRIAKQSLAWTGEPARESAGVAMMALHCAWQVEMKIGAQIRLHRDRNREAGAKKPRRADINDWIVSQLDRSPAAKSPDLWQRAPDWITDQIGERRFAARVTEARKARK